MKPQTILCLVLTVALAGCSASSARRESASKDAALISATAPALISSGESDASEPALATGPDGTGYLVYVEHLPNKDANVFFRRLNAEGQAVGTPVRVNPKAGEATAWRGDAPTVRVAPDGAIYIGWTGRIGPAAHLTNMYLSVSRDGGQTFAAPVRVNDDVKPNDHGMHSLAVGADGRVYVAWLDERSVKPPAAQPGAPEKHQAESNREIYLAISSDGGRTFGPNQKLAGEVCPCCKTAMAVGADGHLYVSWRQVLPGDFRHIAVSSSADGGRTFNAPVIISDDQWSIPGCPVSGPALAVGTDNALRVLWYAAGTAGPGGLYWTESRDGGRTFGARRMVTDKAAQGAPVLLKGPGTSFIAIWQSDSTGSARTLTTRLTSDGKMEEGKLLAEGELAVASAAPDAGQLLVAYVLKREKQRGIWVVKTGAV